jgi:polyisoprenoid-binding protein YceI
MFIIAQGTSSRAAIRVTVLAMLCAIMLAACQTLPPAGTATVPPSTANPPASLTGKLYTVDPDASEIRLLVFRDGPMARVGHNHVMAGRVRGELVVSDTAAASGFRIEIPVASLEVDAPASRAEEDDEFAATVSDQARKGTRDNMLGPDVLDAAHFPLIRIESVALRGPRWNPDVAARITVRGKTSELGFPAAVFEQGDTLIVVAAFRVLQTDLGITPYSILGGAIKVRDAIDIRVRLVARAAAD